MEPEIRPLESHDELSQAEALERVVWGGPPIVPAATMRAVLEVGGCVLGAWLDGELVGFCFGFPGWRRRQPVPPGLDEPAPDPPLGPAPPVPTPPGPGEGTPTVPPSAAPAKGEEREPVFHSDLLAVRPDLRDRGIGRRLKLAQRQWALAQGIHLITCTYDPLQARNGYLNFTRLGGVVRRYVREFYGTLDDELNRGLPADRAVVEWYLRSRRVSRRAAAAGVVEAGRRGVEPAPRGAGGAEERGRGGEAAPDQGARPAAEARPGADAEVPVLNRLRDADGIPEPVGWRPPQGEPAVGVRIPAQFAAWRQGRPHWGLAWRYHLREVLEACLAAGYLMDRCIPPTGLGGGSAGPTALYVLTRRASP